MRQEADQVWSSLTEAAVAVLTEADPARKCAMTRLAADRRKAGELPTIGRVQPPIRPGRPASPQLLAPKHMPKRRSVQSKMGRIALFHALAHIELNAVDLAWDIIARFPTEPLPAQFFDDWLQVADDEARHFGILADLLARDGALYGDLPAHDGLWQASQATAGDLAARLAVVPMVLEARGLDVTPSMIAGLKAAGDVAGAAALQTIHDDEITHVAAGRRWFQAICTRRGCDPVATWQTLVRRYFKGELKPPFNIDSRNRAQLTWDFYGPLALEVARNAGAAEASVADR